MATAQQDGGLASTAVDHGSVVAALRDVTVAFAETTVLHGVDLDLHRGQVHAIVGQNGAGKSTLVKALIGVNRLRDGEILVDGRPRQWRGPQDARAAGLEIVFQDQPLAAHLTVQENMFLGREPIAAGVLLDRSRMRRTVVEVLEEIGAECGPDDLVDDLTPTQRVQISIAAALAASPKVLILDEPTAALGAKESEPVFALIKAATRRGVAVLYISHRLKEITTLADQVTVLRDGRRVLSSPAHELSTDAMITAMVGDRLETLFPERTAPLGEPLLTVDSLRSDPLVTDVSFTVRAGEVVGLAGLVGSGSGEIVGALFGDRPAAGDVRIDGRPALGGSPRAAVRHGFAMVPPERRTEAVFAGLSLRDNIAAASLEAHSRLGIMRPKAEVDTARSVVDRFQVVAHGLNQDFATLSGGNQQKAIVGRWMARGGRVYLVSEPTAGVDVGARIEIYRHLGGLAESGAAVLVSSTDFEELVGLCDRILVVRDGRIADDVAADEVDVEQLTALAAGPVPPSSGELTGDVDDRRSVTEPAQHRRSGSDGTRSTPVGARVRQVSVPAAMLVVLALLVIGAPNLLTGGSILDVLTQAATPALLAVALAVALGSGAFDLSIGATAQLTANLSAVAVVAGVPPAVAVVLGVLVGALVGLINGTVAGVLRVPSFVATLGMLFLLVGITLAVNGGLTVPIPRSSGFLLLGQGWLAHSVPVIVLAAVAAVAVVTLIWRRAVLGLRLRAVGDDAAVAGLRGVPVRRTALAGLLISGALSGLAGVMIASYSSGSTANDNSLTLLVSALAAAFLGASMTRGLLFDPALAAVGALFVTAVGVGLIANGLPDQLLTGAQGLALLFAVLVAVLRRRRLGQVAIF
ncbi:ATP-binding cassette domain-containing protein [Microlunatus soli]|uniref:Ribose transport system ATP-binding protein n=1 Tax=Microlunatus soli TaxID=630515 RepID=A0A1H1YZV1_9ACTN|nr:ATP-binding cassette domain-containing protein [Microlunatus soli]SDT26943.1 ribose transport system ATP-binding protein [Microlunatus soli]